MPRLHPGVLPTFQRAGVQAILHAGDVCVPSVLRELETVAPVNAVRGNRDFVSLPRLPLSLRLEVEGVKIGMTHGHGTFLRYVSEKTHNILKGVKEERYISYVASIFPDMDVIVFGHMHRVVKRTWEGKLVFDPGSACCTDNREKGPSIGLLHINAGGLFEAEVVYLNAVSDCG